MQSAIKRGIICAAPVAPLVSACLSTDTADDCHLLLNCPPPDAGPDARSRA